jgi:hypothetical protein
MITLLLSVIGMQAGTINCPLSIPPGDPIVSIPGSIWNVCLEDLPLAFSDRDYNDQILSLNFNSSGTSANVTLLGFDAAINNRLVYNGSTIVTNAGVHSGVIQTTPNTVVTLQFRSAFNTWNSGTSQVISGCVAGCTPSDVPEPGTFALTALSAVALLAARKFLLR